MHPVSTIVITNLTIEWNLIKTVCSQEMIAKEIVTIQYFSIYVILV